NGTDDVSPGTRYVLGDRAMHQMAQSSVFLSGMGALGVEIAKNIVLAGVKAVTLHDSRQCEVWDLGTNFFIREEDVHSQKKRVEAVHSRVAELNPYVQVSVSTVALDDSTDLSFLLNYQCVVLTETRLTLQKRINHFCHSQQPPIKFIGCDMFGICSRVFCDFGDSFEVSDPTGEESKELFIQNITQDNPGVVTCMDNHTHGLQTGQSVCFREINGMSELNGITRQVTVVSPYSFAIGDTSSFPPYLHGGIFRMIKIPKTYSFVCGHLKIMANLLRIFTFKAPLQIHATMIALDMFQEQHKRLPSIGQPFQPQNTSVLFTKQSVQVCVNPSLVRCVSRCARGCLSPLAAAVGGIASQEVLKALTGKFTPLQQWFYLDALEVVQPLQSLPAEEFAPRGDRYDALRACIGEPLCSDLHKLHIFMVGCGAIGCEMLKNFALLGVGLARCSGEVCVTDPDLIEKSNLNRQFLFRPHHIQKPKSLTAAQATLEINSELQIAAQLNKVCPATEDMYNDAFYSRLNLVVTALDNVEARRYVDSRSVSNQKALLDSGTMGTKGHTEIIVPYLTESYNSHRDPPEEEIPFCTLKSFPAVIEHTIQWARDKFESAFSHKPSMFNTFWQNHLSAEDVLQRMNLGESMEGGFQVIKLLSRRPTHWEHCLALARLKFDKYFKRKALQLLHSFPLDTRLKDGSKTLSLSCLVVFLYICSRLCRFVVDTFSAPDLNLNSPHLPIFSLPTVKMLLFSTENLRMTPLIFEKDDDSNGHMDFVETASALRARMYSIEAADRLQTKRIAGKIIPAIATATAAVAGLVALEMIKVVGGYGFESFKNCFFNLAIPVVVLTETAHVKRIQIRDDISFSIWDQWSITGHEDFTLSDFINAVREKYGIEPTMVVHGVKMLYVPVMPGHSKRLKLTMQKLIKPSAERKYVDLTVSFAPEADGDEDLPGPPVRYYFSHEAESSERA
uniref:Ubiquitin-activating enzyme E1 C-terminal domain-containing protein n=1 Tax=Pygocentrus nattereri TaxID=42514 RepID=A0AAR2KC78_PYGNA